MSRDAVVVAARRGLRTALAARQPARRPDHPAGERPRGPHQDRHQGRTQEEHPAEGHDPADEKHGERRRARREPEAADTGGEDESGERDAEPTGSGAGAGAVVGPKRGERADPHDPAGREPGRDQCHADADDGGADHPADTDLGPTQQGVGPL